MDANVVAKGLFEWMSSFPQVAELGLTQFLDFRDGFGIAVAWNAFAEKKIDVSNLAKPSSDTDWTTIYKNLRVIDGVISPIATEKHFKSGPSVNLTTLARNPQVDDLNRFIQPLVMLALNSPIKTDVIARVRALSTESRRVIKMIVSSYQKSDTAPEAEVSARQKRIDELERQLEAFKTESNTMFRRVNQRQAQDISDLQRAIDEKNEDNKNLEAQIGSAQAMHVKLREQLARVQHRRVALEGVLARDTTERETKARLLAEISGLEQAFDENRRLDSGLVRARREIREVETAIGAADEEIDVIKEELRTTVELGQKYGLVDESITPAENEAGESVRELAARISQMEVEIAIVQDELMSGNSGVPKDTQIVHDELKRSISRLVKRKKVLELDHAQRESLRDDLQRVQKMIVDQREEIETELESLTLEINARNVDLTNWLCYASSFDSWRKTPTLMSKLRSGHI